MLGTERIEHLTPEQQALLPVYRDRWIGIGLSTIPGDHAKAEAAIAAAYRNGGLEPPRAVIWLSSPLHGALGAFCLAQVGAQVWAQVWAQVGKQVRDQVREQVSTQVWEQVGAQVSTQVREQVRAQVGDQVWDQVYRCGYGQHDAAWLAYYSMFADVCGVAACKRLQPLMVLAEHAGWWWPFKNACVVTEKSSALHRDDRGRLHNPAGPALDYGGTWAIYAWHGVRVPGWVITRPAERLTREDVFGLPNAEQRRALIERIGTEAFCRVTEPTVLHEDTAGNGDPRRLLSVDLPNDPDGRLVAVEVRCPSTGRVYLLRVPPGIRDCQSAVAWTFGVEPRDYAPVVER